MVSEPTVLILGAGASAPYGYPSGAALVDKIVEGLDKNNPDRSLNLTLGQLDFSYQDQLMFGKELKESHLLSIDIFLRGRPGFSAIAKAAIGAVLIPLENPNFPVEPTEDWYRYLLNQLVSNFHSGANQPLTILTFNYDRSLDDYIYEGLKRSIDKSDHEIKTILESRLPIIHLHGSLGLLHWQMTQTNKSSRLYGDQTIGLWRNVYKELRIVHEDEGFEEAFYRARITLEHAMHICFLGFGYHPTNVQRLLQGRWSEKKSKDQVIGSAFQMALGERKLAESLFGNRITLGERNEGCLDFIRNHADMLG